MRMFNRGKRSLYGQFFTLRMEFILKTVLLLNKKSRSWAKASSNLNVFSKKDRKLQFRGALELLNIIKSSLARLGK